MCSDTVLFVSCSINHGLGSWGAAPVPSSFLLPVHFFFAAFTSLSLFLLSMQRSLHDCWCNSLTACPSLCGTDKGEVSFPSSSYGDDRFRVSMATPEIYRRTHPYLPRSTPLHPRA